MFFVLHVRDQTFRPLSASTLITNLQRDWPGVEISRHPRDAVRDVAWTYRDDDGVLEGSQDREGNGHYLSGPNRLVARYAVWWRRHVPSSHPMLLYDEAYSISVDIERDTTIETIEAAIGD
jgi:hypothetical protein